ncbi:MAG: diguanylate cyclase [Halanaerobiales bacterium]|nr:diguanylate cyclase [Halanaerobiales bacterium]
MDTNNLGSQLNLIKKSKVILLVNHQENRKILENYLTKKYEVLTTSDKFEDVDIIIVDEPGFAEYKDQIISIKQSNTSLYLPLILITRVSYEKIPDKYMKIIDEIVQTPIKQKILNSRIKNLLNVRKLFLSTQIYQNLTDKNPTGISILFEDNKIKYVNKAFLDILEEKKKNILEKKITNFIKNKTFNKYLSKQGNMEKEKLTIKLTVNNQEKWVDLRYSNLVYQNINLKLIIMVDVSKQKQYEKEIKHLRFHDQLTGLYNRDYFMEEIKRLDTKRQLPLTIIMGDINSLKLVNDVFGHDQGDQLIKNTAQILEKNLRDEDILARIGGDEFAILLPNTNYSIGKAVSQRINQNCSNFVGEGIISIALGVATKNNISQDIDHVFKTADDNMYQNKTSESIKAKQEIISNINKKLRKETDESQDHIKTVKKLVLKFAEKLNLNSEQNEKLKLLAESHDIGKISVKEEVEKNISQLTEEEHEKLKGHAEYGYRISHSIPELSNIADLILSHHERWDGKGYPQGLKHEEIPLLARIFTIVDNYDLLVNGRGEKNTRSKETALKEIKRQADDKFDPDLVKEFISLIKNEN